MMGFIINNKFNLSFRVVGLGRDFSIHGCIKQDKTGHGGKHL